MNCAIVAAIAALTLALPDTVRAADIRILSPGATEGVLSEILPEFEKAAGHKVSIEYGPVGGLAARITRGEAADVVILSDAEADKLRDQKKTITGSQVVIAKVGIGVFVRKGDPKPDIGTAESFLRALTDAKVIAYGDPKLGGSASIVVGELLKSLDTNGSIAAKTKLVPPAKPLVDLVAAGGVDFAFQPISQIYLDPRIEYVGPLPSPYQYYTPYVASQVATSKQASAYTALIAFLSTPASGKVWRSKGFEPR